MNPADSMVVRIAGMLAMWALGAFAAREAYRNHLTGVGHMFWSGPRQQRREDDPAAFRSLLIAKVVAALICFVAGALWLVHPWGMDR